MEITINIDAFYDLKKKVAPLCVMHGGQTYDAFLCLDEHGKCSFQLDPPWETGCSAEVWHDRTLRWELPAGVNGSNIYRLLMDASTIQLLQRVHEGHEIVWDGNNYSGVLDDDAQEASDELETLFGDEITEASLWTIWEVDDWLWCSGQSLLDNWPNGLTLAEAAQKIIEDAVSQDVYCGSLTDVKEALMKQLNYDIEKSGYEPTAEQQAALDGDE
ncbi:hypothetical protein [Hydrogenophaga atypica]|uniref:DUF4376 domain-containing protein n=1 Tax=Hydrogenophaga atypica TaxID=249409 RepID=A0ABW2QIZ4_9BURK